MPYFRYQPDIMTQFPETVGGIIIGTGVSNSPSSEALKAKYTARQQQVKAQIGDTPLSEITSLSAWRRTFSSFGVNPTKYRSAAESLLRRLTKKGDIPSINTLVDIGNLISITYGIPVAIVDIATLKNGLTVHFSDGTENYTELNSDEITHPETGEVVFTDDDKTVYARRWCWRQSAQSAARETTQNVIITIEARHDDGRASVEQAIAEIVPLLTEYAGGTYQSFILDSDRLATSD